MARKQTQITGGFSLLTPPKKGKKPQSLIYHYNVSLTVTVLHTQFRLCNYNNEQCMDSTNCYQGGGSWKIGIGCENSNKYFYNFDIKSSVH